MRLRSALLSVLVAVIVAVLGFATPAAAAGPLAIELAIQTDADGPPIADDQPTAVDPGPALGDDTVQDTTLDVTFSVPWAVFITGSLIPLIVAAMARSTWNETWKGRVNFILSVATAAFTVFIDTGGSVPILQLLSAVAATLLASELTYRTLWKGSTVQRTLLAFGGGDQPQRA